MQTRMDRARANRSKRCMLLMALVALITTIVTLPVYADGKLGIYGIYLTPHNTDAKTLSRPGWGAGGHVVVPIPAVYKLLAGTLGFEYVNMGSEVSDVPNDLGLEATREINQNMYRLFLGGEIGPHGRGFLRPHVGVNIAWVLYRVNGKIVVPDDIDPNNEATQFLFNEYNSQFGFDTTLGVDFNFTRFVMDAGVRYIKSFGQVQQLNNALVDVHPDYFQVYLGIGIGFDEMGRKSSKQPAEEG